MNRTARNMSRLVLCATLATVASSAFAQQNTRRPNNRQNYGGNNNGATLELPQDVRRVVGIDAQNVLLAELEPETAGGPSEYRAIPVQHVYVGGIAKLFGGESISTEEFVSPAYSKNGGFGQMNQGGNFGGAQGFGQNNGFQNGGQNGYNNGFNTGYPVGNGFNGASPNDFYPNGNGFAPNVNSGLNGGFVGSPVVTYGVGNLIRNKRVQNQNGGTVTTQESR